MPSRKLALFALAVSVILVLIFALPVGASPPSGGAQTYTVLVGWENPHQGIDINNYFPENVSIHAGDTVHWVLNSNEIHTVTFLAGAPIPDLVVPSQFLPGADPSFSPVVFVPVAVTPVRPQSGQYDGTTWVNSSLLGRDPGMPTDFSLTFTTVGSFDYVCLVHGVMMSGEINVVGDGQSVPSPEQAAAEGRKEIASALAQVPAIQREANGQIVPPVKNADGSTAFTVMLGYGKDMSAGDITANIDLMQFFPDKLVVRPGDTVTYELSEHNDAPHTVTFLNGASDAPLAVPHGQFLYINPDVALPSPLAFSPLTRTGIFNSGLLIPGTPFTSFTYTIGDMTPGLQPWLCQLHDASGMTGRLMVVPR